MTRDLLTRDLVRVVVPLRAQAVDGHAPVAMFTLDVAERPPTNGVPAAFLRGLRLMHPRYPGEAYGGLAAIRIEIDGQHRASVLGVRAIGGGVLLGIAARAVFTIEARGVNRATLFVDIDRVPAKVHDAVRERVESGTQRIGAAVARWERGERDEDDE